MSEERERRARVTLGPEDGVDLHLHTVVSDGRWTPETLAEAAAAAHVRLMAITDHDALEALAPGEIAARERGMAFLPGVELTAGYQGEMLHVLALGIDPTLPALLELLKNVQGREHARAERLLQRLIDGGALTPTEEERAALRREPRLTQAKLVPLMRNHGYPTPADYRPAMKRVMDASFAETPLERIVEALRPEGVPLIVAHPGAPMLEYEGVTRNLTHPTLLALLQAGLVDGIEVYNKKHLPAQVERYAALVEEHHLLASCGSDSHSNAGPLPTPFPAAQCRALLERCGVDVR